MNARWMAVACMAAGLLCLARPAASQPSGGQSWLAEVKMPDEPMAAKNTPEDMEYATAKQAIHDGRWADAVRMFGEIAVKSGEHAAGALYWKAYAESELGRTQSALSTCGVLRAIYPKSSWKDDCEALGIEIQASSGKPARPTSDQSDESKLLALASLMQKDPDAATEQIRTLVDSDASERLKEGAVFVLGERVPDSTYPQIVRISYLEGDVRIARASENEKTKSPAWESAVMNLPLSEGDSIATGKDGRAEIEFEDASTIYLDADSVLNCADLHTTAGVPHTELALVSGTMTTHLNSLMPGETFLLRTPTDSLLTRFPQKSDLRITSYLDGVAITPLAEGVLNVTGTNKMELSQGKTLYFNGGHAEPSLSEPGGAALDFAGFDAWVADRYAGRNSANTEMMKEAGLQKPVPGLAEMQGKGHFFECPPYGTCWQPDAPQSKAVLSAPPAPPPTPKSAPASAAMPSNAGSAAIWPGEWFPCMSTWYPGTMAGRGAANYTGYPVGYLQDPTAFYVGLDPYAWAVCHSGWWIPYNDNYVWVAGSRRHHKCPVKWIKVGRQMVAVPLHPKDIKNKPPVNHGLGFEPVKGKGGVRLTPVKFDPGKQVDVVKSPPKEFRSANPVVLTRVGAPPMRTFALRENSKAGVMPHTPIPMNFNHQQGFTASHQVMQGGRTVAVNVPVGGSHAGGGVPGGGFGGAAHGSAGFGAHGSAGFGAVGASHAGGGSGGSHAGGGGGGGGHVGGGASGGGGAHGGGGASAASASSSASSSSSGGSHK